MYLEAETASGTMGTMSGVVVKQVHASSGDRQGPDEPHHRDVQGGASRAAVFGISDGLLTNISLILGVAGAHPAAGVVRLAGFAGLVAGAFSMAAGEYVSMTAQKELLHRELDVERKSLRDSPKQERAELVAVYEQRGVRREVAEEVAKALMSSPERALETHSREELGVNPQQTGEPKKAAASSFVSFAVGAVIPLLPWFFISGVGAIIASIVLGTVSALAIGWGLGVATGRSPWKGAVRQLGIAAVAAAVTYGVGSLLAMKTS
jgi:VIT1/CCC1 family predicted Fe2+/Mn2+ transporter